MFGGVPGALLNEYIQKSHKVSVLLSHGVCLAQYRRVVFGEEGDATLKEVCQEISQRDAIVLLDIGTEKPHVHCLL